MKKSSGTLEIPEIPFLDSGNLNSGSSNGDDMIHDVFDASDANDTATSPTLTNNINCEDDHSSKGSERKVILGRSSGKRILCQPLIYEAKSSCDR